VVGPARVVEQRRQPGVPAAGGGEEVRGRQGGAEEALHGLQGLRREAHRQHCQQVQACASQRDRVVCGVTVAVTHQRQHIPPAVMHALREE